MQPPPPPTNPPPTIRYQRITKTYAKTRPPLLQSINLTLTSGEATLLCGENGSGKTTLLRILSGLEPPDRPRNAPPCQVLLPPHPTPKPWHQTRKTLQRQIMYLHQQPYVFDRSVTHNLHLALPKPHPTPATPPALITQALHWSQLQPLAAAPAKTLSSGQLQRLALARAWLRQSRFLLLDEPIANMDPDAQARTIALLHQLKQNNCALLIASHNHQIFANLINRTLTLKNGTLHPHA